MLANTELGPLLRKAEELLAGKDYGRALDLYDLCLAVNPDDPHLRYCVASLYSELYKSGIAISMLKGVVKDMPAHSQAWNNLGIAYKNSGQWEKAHEAYEKSLALNYCSETLVNMSGLYINNATPEQALRWAQKGLKLAPNSPQLLNHRALAWLEMGNWKEGFPAYDARFGLPGWSARSYHGSLWKGERVKKLLIHGEQGLGDEILFLGTLDRVRERADEVVLECAKRLVPIFEHSFGVRCYAREEEIKASESGWDAWVPMGSLFNIVGFEEKGAYLKVEKPYSRANRFRVGVSFRGGTVQTHEHLRNFNLDWWKPLLEHDAEFISVQYGPAAGMAKEIGLPHDQEAIDDAERLMGMIQSCDLIISVCNTTVHMAASLGVPCWCLTPSRPSWQFQLSGDKVPWYKSVDLIRQASGEDWRSVIQRTKTRLTELGIGIQRAAA